MRLANGQRLPGHQLLEEEVAGEQLHRGQVTDICGADAEVSDARLPVALWRLSEISEPVGELAPLELGFASLLDGGGTASSSSGPAS
jgi:hypothetical protein